MADNLSKLISCRHCGNISKMEIIGNVNDDQTEYDPEYGPMTEWGVHYSVLKCPACQKTNIVSHYCPTKIDDKFMQSII